MKRNRIIEQLVISFAICLFIIFSPSQVGAADNSIEFYMGEQSSELGESKTAEVVNGETTSSLTILEEDQVLFEKEMTAIKVTSLEKVVTDNGEYVIAMYRYDGSANALMFEVLKLEDRKVTSLYTSEVYANARYQVQDNEIVVDYIEPKANGIQTEPDKLITQTFGIEQSSVTVGEKKIQEPVVEKSRAELNASNGTNPSNAEISRILTEEALKAGIAPEILKAIAFQESGWQQYWDTVPDSIKENCPNYDGTNVKLGYDCIGIGIMQISNQMYMKDGPEKEAYIERLKTDIRFNIQEGIKILKDKWNYSKSGLIPTVNDNDPMAIENWYFAILAYNGLLPRNNPIDNAFTAYQEKVYHRIEEYSLLDLTPFPTHKLDPYRTENNQIRFHNTNVVIEGPLNYSGTMLEKGDTGYITENSVRLRSTPGGSITGSLNKGTKVTITGDYVGDSSRYNHYVWLPIRTSSGQTGYVASSYVNSSEYIDVYLLSGSTRYDTAVSVANHGWHLDQPTSVVIANGVLPVDALTGSVLASSLNAPVLLSRTDKLADSTLKELARIKPKTIYILGGTSAISEEVATKLSEYGTIVRISGDNRYETAKVVANEVGKRKTTNEIFVTTGDNTSSDPLAIAPYAGDKGIPILLTRKDSLNPNVEQYIKENKINKVTIIGGSSAVANKVENQLKTLVGTGNVQRVSGDTRYGTNLAIIKKYYTEDREKLSNNPNLIVFNNLVVAQGLDTADALSAASFATKIDAPILLTRTDSLPTETRGYLNSTKLKPDLYFLGGPAAIDNNVRTQIKSLVK